MQKSMIKVIFQDSEASLPESALRCLPRIGQLKDYESRIIDLSLVSSKLFYLLLSFAQLERQTN